jgi:bacterioferritin (cytochrome b1)
MQNLGKLLIGKHVAECLSGDLKYETGSQHPLLMVTIDWLKTAILVAVFCALMYSALLRMNRITVDKC